MLQILHWLPVRQRIHFQILLITYKSINDMAPEYLCELVSIEKSSRTKTPVIQSDTIAGASTSAQVIWYCTFSVATPNLWNKLPVNIRNVSSLESLSLF